MRQKRAPDRHLEGLHSVWHGLSRLGVSKESERTLLAHWVEGQPPYGSLKDLAVPANSGLIS